MGIIGVHTLLYTSEPEQVRAILRDVFGFKSVEVHDGWLIFGLPPAELGVHPAEAPHGKAGTHAISFMCDDIHATVKALRAKGITIHGEPSDQGWGVTVMMALPGDCMVMLYEPRHPLAIQREHGGVDRELL
jgi:catechol 2,3-dioxygenase-like lactoylglutathione lyase family enzyme